jgi:hypothetical protein
MIDAPAILREIEVAFARTGCLVSEEDLQRWHAYTPQRQTELFDALGAQVAREYHSQRLSFEFCDTLVNHLYGIMIFQQGSRDAPPWPKLFWRVYEAFDAGEWSLPSNPSFDPIATYTDPDIADIVRELDDAVGSGQSSPRGS